MWVFRAGYPAICIKCPHLACGKYGLRYMWQSPAEKEVRGYDLSSNYLAFKMVCHI